MYFSFAHGEKSLVRPNVAPIANSAPPSVETNIESAIAVLISREHRVNKKFGLDSNDQVSVVQYPGAYTFDFEVVSVCNIFELADLVTRISANPFAMVIRGLPTGSQSGVSRRTKDHFQEHPDGTQWVMLDFDNVPVPDGIDPLTPEAISWVISRLPTEFHNVTCFYQFSASAGIMNGDGSPRKSGLNVHIFFWLNRRVPGPTMAAYLRKHCLDTGFYSIDANRGGVCQLKYGIDPAPIRSEVQPHFTAAPEIADGVQCLIAGAQRQGLLQNERHTVSLPMLASTLEWDTNSHQRRIRQKWMLDNGRQMRTLLTRTSAGIALTSYYVSPASSIQGGRAFSGGKLSGEEQKYFILDLDDENTPGSWYVSKSNPQLARRFGDYAQLPLKELSLGAHAYVRDTLAWFWEIPHQHMSLTEEGYLPALSGFANAKVSVVLSPTGSGKTKATIDWIRRSNGLVIYCAPTITLVNQMQADLTAAGISNQNYRTVWSEYALTEGVIVTTNKSLKKVLSVIAGRGHPYSIVFDEIHESLDELMKGMRLQQTLEGAIGKARKTFLLTGTLTDVQRKTIVSVVSSAMGGLQDDDFSFYEFAPVKHRPLELHRLECFGSDFMKLLGDLRAKREAGEPLPQVVMLLPTSKLEAFRMLLVQHGLGDVSSVVSRTESSEGEIAEAQDCITPIIVSSPLFALGLNFRIPPAIFWAKFDHINADTSRIIQTLNRANRGDTICDVRLYVGELPDDELKLPAQAVVKADIKDFFSEESTISGSLEEHFTIDRATYQTLRDTERQTSYALSALVRSNGFQNYAVVDRRRNGSIDKENKDSFREVTKAARVGYAGAIEAQALKFNGCPRDSAFASLDRLNAERQRFDRGSETRTGKEIRDEELGILMAICDVDNAKVGSLLCRRSLSVLFCEALPWISEQFDPEHHLGWGKVRAEKSEAIAYFVGVLANLKRGQLNGLDLATKLTRDKRFGEGVIAMARSEADYLALKRKLKILQEARVRARSNGAEANRATASGMAIGLLEEILARMGIRFEAVVGSKPKEIDYTKPVIPASWDLAEMERQLLLQASMLRRLPENLKSLNTKYEPDDTDGYWPDLVPLNTCKGCAFLRHGLCAQGHWIDWSDFGIESAGEGVASCDGFKAIKIKLAA